MQAQYVCMTFLATYEHSKQCCHFGPDALKVVIMLRHCTMPCIRSQKFRFDSQGRALPSMKSVQAHTDYVTACVNLTAQEKVHV